ncbi:MAG: GH116 family glycosyl hydrolase, partial [Planctomycetia bacterium]|nr:GH116 family glycosyl hydrolase [Planctomycetia bacterium]
MIRYLWRLMWIWILAGMSVTSAMAAHPFNGSWTGANLNRIAFPIGGIGTGMYCLEGTGAISHMSVRHQMEFFHEPTTFAAICVRGASGSEPVARVIEGPIPDWKYFGRANTGLGLPGATYGLPRFRTCEFTMRFPFCETELTDDRMPLTAKISGFSPFIPTDADDSSIPAGSLEYTFTNTGNTPVDAVFSMNTTNFMGNDGVSAIEGGFRLNGSGGSFAFIAMNEPDVVVNHCWYRGGWWDAMTIAWHHVQTCQTVQNPPVSGGNVPGASLYVPFTVQPGASRTIRILTVWYVPHSDLAIGTPEGSTVHTQAFSEVPSHGTARIGQQPVTGYRGSGLVNTFDPHGDRAVGTLESEPFTAQRRYLHFLVGGGKGDGVGVSLLVDEDPSPVQTVRGSDQEQLRWVTWDLSDAPEGLHVQNRTLRIRISDHETGPWGHINADHFMMSDEPLDPQRPYGMVLADFEGGNYGCFHPVAEPEQDTESEDTENDPIPSTYAPWYSVKYDGIEDVAKDFTDRYEDLVTRSRAFSDCLYHSTLPPEVIEAMASNLSILKSPTVLRQYDGRIWGWEGNNDVGGSCAGTCTHVWNYAQAMPHLFPDLERSLRDTEFGESLRENGEQAFRANLPISPGGVAWGASDGQFGGIMKVRREWKISGDDAWMRAKWPAVKRSLDYMIRTWDPRETGLPEESHHNTYDINYRGPEGHCGSFCLGALAAASEMAAAAGDEDSVRRYTTLLAKGRHRMETTLFNGEYFVQIVPKPGDEGNPDVQSEYFRQVAETIDAQGPKYQYGDGCLSDGVLGFWMAKVCGIEEDLVDPSMIASHLDSVYRYNLKRDLSEHSNPQRPTYAMGDEGGLLLCTWPRGNRPLLPFVYSDEVWTGIEYQVASHLMMIGRVKEGLEIVRICRKRCDGVRRNPMNEYECGHWYARAMSSFALLQGMYGVRYDATTETLTVPIGDGQDFRAPIFTATGFGIVERHDGQVEVTVSEGTIPIASILRE